MIAALLPSQNREAGAADGSGLFPWQQDPVLPAGVAPIGVGFELGLGDLTFILQQIKIAEHHMGPTFDPADPCGNLIGPGPDQIPEGSGATNLPFGLRTLNGICNNLVPGQEKFGSTDEPFIRLTSKVWRDGEDTGPPGPPGPPVLPTTYNPAMSNPYGIVADSQPRIISNLIVDQTASNPAATAAAGPSPVLNPSGSYDIENTAPDEGLSAPFNSMFTFFGQFFDHGLDLTTKSGETVFMPLQMDDPLLPAAAAMPFMLLSRAQVIPDVDPVNQTSPFVDQNQTYTSHPSQQVFQREYSFDPMSGVPSDTGRLLVSDLGPDEGMAKWSDVKTQALLLGFELHDEDVLSVPLMAADFYGNFLPGAGGFPQMVFPGPDMMPGTLDDVLMEGNPMAPVSTRGMDGVDGGGDDALGAGRAWLVDIAHHAVPGTWDHDSDHGMSTAEIPQVPDTVETCNPMLPGSQIETFCDDGDAGTYDNEMLDAHFVCGDGRCNENIALTSVHHVFHSEHNRLVEHIMDTLTADATPAILAEWQTSPGVFNGQRIFQAAKFATEMQYQHLAFEEFARKVQPFVNEFIGYDESIDARISAEFAHAVYRFGHSMLTEEVARFDTDTGVDHSLGLIEAFLNPPEFYADTGGTFTKTPDKAAGGILAGAVSIAGQHIDEFVVEALRNNLVGLPLDLPAINLARGRDAGLAPLNQIRAEIFAMTSNNPAYTPYDNWFEFELGLNTPESIINFIAAYGDDSAHGGVLNAATTMLDKRTAAATLHGDSAFMMDDGATTGVDDIDLWVGGLAEKKEIFGGLLGSTMNFFFELQMENLQDGDRFYYLHRLNGLPMLASLEGNSFAELIERNTTAELLPADVFSKPTYTFNLEVAAMTQCGGIVDDAATPWDEAALLIEMGMPECTIRYTDAEHVNISGRVTGDDFIHSGEGDDTIRGHGGDDRLEGSGGNDGIIGGEGDDIITDNFGDDSLKGGPGDDAIHGGPGVDLLQGGTGKDFIVIGSDPGEILAGTGDDFLLGGDSFDVLFGDEGDDWVEGGSQADLLQGDAGMLIENNPLGTDGNDVLYGNGGNDDYLGEGGDDIFIFSPGRNAYDGVLGYDWITHRSNPLPGDTDLNRFEFLPPDLEPLESRFDLVEAASGWHNDDVLIGTGILPDLFIVGDNSLTLEGIARITDLDTILPPGTIIWGGNILLGGGGSDHIEPQGLDDVIDGDAWLNVQLCIATGGVAGARTSADCLPGDIRADSLTELTGDVFNGLTDPGDIVIVREILWEAPGTDLDTVEFAGPLADYDITQNLDGSVSVLHARNTDAGGGGGGGGNCPQPDPLNPVPCDDGFNLLWNIERLQFSDQIIGTPCDTCLLRVTTEGGGGGLPSHIIVDGSPRDRWGLNWMKISPGAHEVCFSEIEGWVAPACEIVNVAAGMTGVVNGVFNQMGTLQVTTSPAVPSTITVNGVPTNDWAVWTDFPVGNYDVCFGDVADFDAPACQNVNVTAGVTTAVVGTFTANMGAAGPAGPYGLLRVTTQASIGGGGVGSEIIVDGVGLDRWALNWMKLAPGEYVVCFSDLANFDTPACEVAVITDGGVTVINGVFEDRAVLRVQTVAPHASTITANGLALNDWGVWTDIAAGVYQICFGEADGFTPACQVETLVAGALTEVQGNWP